MGIMEADWKVGNMRSDPVDIKIITVGRKFHVRSLTAATKFTGGY